MLAWPQRRKRFPSVVATGARLSNNLWKTSSLRQFFNTRHSSHPMHREPVFNHLRRIDRALTKCAAARNERKYTYHPPVCSTLCVLSGKHLKMPSEARIDLDERDNRDDRDNLDDRDEREDARCAGNFHGNWLEALVLPAVSRQ